MHRNTKERKISLRTIAPFLSATFLFSGLLLFESCPLPARTGDGKMHTFFSSRAFIAGASATGLMAYSVTRSFAKADTAASPQSVKLNSNLLNPKCAGVASFLRLHGVSDVKTVLSNPFSGQDVNAGILMLSACCF
jgi:hypothetical protein